MILVTGFGAFPGVNHNPTADLVRALNGRRVQGHTLVGEVLEVRWLQGPRRAVRLAHLLRPALVLGFGVATQRGAVCVERLAHRHLAARPDAAGELPPVLDGPEVVSSSLDVQRLAEALDGESSEDAGRYVCNAWLYQVALALDVPVGFVHVPAQGLAVSRCLGALDLYLKGA
jgi:pyroglutamyl-peptidase